MEETQKLREREKKGLFFTDTVERDPGECKG